MTTTANWIRTTALTIGSISIDKLTIHFTIQSGSSTTAAAAATIKIYNLAPATIAKITPGDPVTLTAGYQNDNGITYLGRIKTITAGRNSADTYTELTCTDYTWPEHMPTRTYPRGTPVGTIIRTLYADAAIPPGALITDHGITCADPYTTDPDGKTTLDQLISIINGDPEIIKNKLTVHHVMIAGTACIIAENQTIPDIYLLSAATGLLSTTRETDDSADQSATTLLLWRMQTDAVILLDTATASGRYKVVSYRHQADTDHYQTELKLRIL